MTATKAASLKKQMAKQREAISCISPSGHDVVIKPPNVEMHVLSGGLPSRLKQLAQEGIAGIDQAINAAQDADPELLTYLCGIAARTFVEPEFDPPTYELQPVDEKEPDGDQKMVCVKGDHLDDYLLPADFKWVLLVAFGESDEDGLGNRLWGREPLSRFAPFRQEHGCTSDCEGCGRVEARFSVGRDL